MTLTIGARQASMNLSEIAGLLGFFPHNHLEGLQRVVQKKDISSSSLSGQRENGDTHSNQSIQQSISELTTPRPTYVKQGQKTEATN